ncbi:MAG TPA: hypothetical protein VJ888_08800 [Mobilitalea sp.]|nr:hypothetical protein [Mobilitalea sp.]
MTGITCVDICDTAGQRNKNLHAAKRAAKRKFVRESGQVWKVICSTGRTVANVITNELTPEDDAAVDAYKAGKKDIGKVVDSMGFFGVRSAYEMVLDKATQIANITAKTEKIITAGSLTLSDLGKSKEDSVRKH